MQCLIRLNSNPVCGTSGTVVSVIKVHCLCDVSCCLAMDQERLQGRFSQMDVRTLIKFHILLGKSPLQCYKLLKEGLGPRETVYRWVNSTKNGLEETGVAPNSGTPTSVTDEFHKEQVKSVHEYMHSISCTGIAIEDGISAVSVYLIPTNSLGKQKVCALWIPHMLNNDQRAMHVIVITHL